ncbi:MAG: exonuclease subunit SbcD [Fibrobacter sp.]|jgi:exonuclease SbcD|nr:exonuclease subunit SbcD [Fibrobacter sp.]
MKFIHTSDWHLGNTMHDIDRTNEASAFLEWLKNEIDTAGAQALVVAGDIFDVVNPSNAAKSQYYRFLASLLTTGCKNVVVVGGNHDSGALLDAPSEILEALNIKVVGSINNRKIEDMVFVLKGSDGEPIGVCCAVPFMRDMELEQFYKSEEKGETTADESLLKRLYSDVYQRALELRGSRNIPIIATGHLYASGLSGRESEDALESTAVGSDGATDDGVREVVGTLGNVDVSVFPADLDYVALGHIHYATKVADNPKVWYSGSPFVMGFDEANYKRYVFAVDSEAGNLPSIQKIIVPRTIRFEQYKGDLDTLKKKLRNLEKELLDSGEETYVDLLLTSGEFVNLTAALEVEEKDKHFVVKRHRLAREILRKGVSGIDDAVESTKQYTKEDYFRMLIAKNMNENGDSEQVKAQYEKFIGLFNEAVNKAHENA